MHFSPLLNILKQRPQSSLRVQITNKIMTSLEMRYRRVGTQILLMMIIQKSQYTRVFFPAWNRILYVLTVVVFVALKC